MNPSTNLSAAMFPRRELLQRLASAALLFFVPRPQSVALTLNGRALPEFNIGDSIAVDWTDEFGEDFIEFGEVVGICHRPEDGWVYYIPHSAPTTVTHQQKGDEIVQMN